MEVIKQPHAHDVLSGRGNGANLHPGNIYFRSLIAEHKATYVSSSHKDKKNIKSRIVEQIQNRSPSGRFLHKNNTMTGVWDCMNHKEALKKTGQALREDAPRMRSASELAQPQKVPSTILRAIDDEMNCSAEDNATPSELDMNQLGKDFNKSLDLSEVLNCNQAGDYGHTSSNRIDQNILDLLMASASSMISSNSNSLNISDAASLDQMDISQKEFNMNAPSFHSAPPFAINFATHAQSSDTNSERPILHSLRKFKSLSGSASSLNCSDFKFPLEGKRGARGFYDESERQRFEESLDFDKSLAEIDFSQSNLVQDVSEGIQTEGSCPPTLFALNNFKSLSGRSLSMRSLDSQSNSSIIGSLKEEG